MVTIIISRAHRSVFSILVEARQNGGEMALLSPAGGPHAPHANAANLR